MAKAFLLTSRDMDVCWGPRNPEAGSTLSGWFWLTADMGSFDMVAGALTIEAVGEALLFASKAGADPAKVRQALMGGFASSRILELHGERILRRNFTPGFRIELHQKDLGLALEGARALGLSLPNTATCEELFNSCVANGLAKADHAAMVSALELLAKHSIVSESAKS